jgi:hypothetical protein
MASSAQFTFPYGAGRDAVAGHRTRSTARWSLGILLGLVLALISLGAWHVDQAAASSTKCAFYGTGIKYGVRNGSFCDTVNGTGTYVQTVTGSFGTTIVGLDTICYPSMKIDFYDASGRWIAWRQGPQRAGCYPWAFNSVPTIGVWANFPAARGGSARVTLQSYGRSIVENWHGIS